MKITKINPEIDRRSFIKLVSVAGVGSMVLPGKIWGSESGKNSRIISVTDDLATSGLNIDKEAVQTMMDFGIMELAQIWDVGGAWKALFPGISTNKIIAIKVNCASSGLPSHPVVTDTIINSLKKIQFGDSYFPENNIIIYERTDYELINAGFTINDSASGVRCFGTNHSGVGFSSHTFPVNGQNKKISRIVSDMADYIINLSVLKNHSLSGVTLCLKNHYGTVQDAITMHGNHCDPWIPALNAIDPIINKNVVNIIDGLFGIKSGGPGGNSQFTANNFIMSTDIVAVDFLGTELLRENGCSTTNIATHIATAVTYGLGTNQPSQMDLVEIFNPTLMNVSVSQPNGGENLIPENMYSIQWESTNLNNVKIEYSTNDGLDWINIIDSIAASTGLYNWMVPNTPSDYCKLRISSIDSPYINDISDGSFIILPDIFVETQWENTNLDQRFTWKKNINIKQIYTFCR